jgi:hypothetical protein
MTLGVGVVGLEHNWLSTLSVPIAYSKVWSLLPLVLITSNHTKAMHICFTMGNCNHYVMHAIVD